MSKKKEEVNEKLNDEDVIANDEVVDGEPVGDVAEDSENEQSDDVQTAESESEQPKTPEALLLEAGQTIAKLTVEIKEAQDQYLRLRAEFDNYRKRVNNEIESHKVKGIGMAIEAFFPAMDGLDKAIKMCNDEEFSKGLSLVKKQFETALKKLGVVEIDPLDQDFNPEYHNAVMNEVNSEKVGKVIEVFQKGYRYKDTLLRPAMVKVGVEE